MSFIRTVPFGGDGGYEFDPCYVKSIGMRTGARVDALFINGTQHGGDGGDLQPSLTFDDDEYISAFYLRSDAEVDYLQFTTNLGRQIGGGGDGGYVHTSKPNIRVIALGGRSGGRLDRIAIKFIEDYVPSKFLEKGHFIIGYTAQNTKLTRYSESIYNSMSSYERITERMLQQKYSASVEGEFYAKVSASTEINIQDSELLKIKIELSEQLKSKKSEEIDIQTGMVGILLVAGDIMQGSDGKCWMFPTTDLSYSVISMSDFENVLDHYDLTGQLFTQMPGLKAKKIEKNGYTYYAS